MITIKQVPKEQILQLRHDVLRQGKPLDSANFEEDDRIGTIHLAYFDDDGKVVGCATMIVTADASFETIPQYRLRGMAVEPKSRNKLVGTALVKMAEFVALNNQVECVWLNARETAKDFYAKLGYKTVGKPFEIDGVGVHYKMVNYPTEHVCNHDCGECTQKGKCQP